MSDDAIQDLITECRVRAVGKDLDTDGDRIARMLAADAERAQAQHTANRDVIASLRSSLEGRAAEVALLKASREMDLAILRSDVSRFLALAEALGVDPRELSNGYAPLHIAIAELQERAEQAEAKVARLESAIADHVIEEGRLNRVCEQYEAYLYGPPNPELTAFVGKLKSGGLIVSTSVLVPMEISIATAEDRLFVDRDGLGFVYVGAQISPEWVARKFGGPNGQ